MSRTDIQDAQPCDIYVDPMGNVWQIIGICSEPTVIAQRLTAEGSGERRTAGISGFLWDGFRRVHKAGRD